MFHSYQHYRSRAIIFSHFIGWETEAQRGSVTCPKSHSCKGIKAKKPTHKSVSHCEARGNPGSDKDLPRIRAKSAFLSSVQHLLLEPHYVMAGQGTPLWRNHCGWTLSQTSGESERQKEPAGLVCISLSAKSTFITGDEISTGTKLLFVSDDIR